MWCRDNVCEIRAPLKEQILQTVSHLAAVSSDGSAKLWDCGSGSCITDLISTQCPINACALSTSAVMAEKNTTEPPGITNVGMYSYMYVCVNG